MKRIIEHEMIMASAGSGKTYALGVRLIRLLALGVAPERIVALTFTRKAAAEFLDVMLGRLAKAAGNENEAQRLATETGCPDLGAKQAAKLLATVARAVNKLNLTTIDSFFTRIVRSFPYEMGIGGSVDILDPISESSSRRQVMRAVFAISAEDLRKAFLESFKRATFGESKKDLRLEIAEFVRHFHNAFLLHPLKEHWGDRKTIWQGNYPWDSNGSGLAEALECMLQFAANTRLPDRSAGPFVASFNALMDWQVGQPLPKTADYFLDRYLIVAASSPPPTIKIGRATCQLDPNEQAAMHTIAKAMVSSEIQRALERTTGLHELLQLYDREHHRLIRENGKLSFADFPLLLRSALLDPVIHLNFAFRMDARFEHWLLDEFQDTSRLQWEVLREFIDEVLQDSAHSGSFYYVGDVKQAIYSWRGGDVALFNEIFEHYNQGSSAHIIRRDLTASYRCRPALIELVNSVFGNADVIQDLLPGEAAANWNREWRHHQSACNDCDGHAAVFLAPKGDCHAAAVNLIEKIDPIARGQTCAVLVATNSVAREMAELLRARNIPTVLEGTIQPGADNHIGLFVRALVSAAAHPGDSFARCYLQMTPLVRQINGARTLPQLLEAFRLAVGQAGFESGIRMIVETVTADLTLDTFNRQRLDMILAAAREFDLTGQPGYNEFLRYITDFQIPGNSGSNAIQVMTIHRSKGLGFDCVILPNLESNTLFEAREGLLCYDDHHSHSWALLRPTQAITACDPVLDAQVQVNKQEACYEKLCTLYVAMTRAKRATYIFLNETDSQSSNYNTLLKTALSSAPASPLPELSPLKTIATFGTPVLQSSPATPLSEPAITVDSRSIGPPPAWVTAARITPSGSDDDERFQPASISTASPARAIGSRLHEVLATVADETDLQPRLDQLQQSTDPIGQRVAELLANAISNPKIYSIFHTPDTPYLLWRERSFEVMIDDQWVSGTFDRVTIHLGDSQTPVAANLVDFKSATTPAPADQTQIKIYQQALGKILNLPTSEIQTTIACLG